MAFVEMLCLVLVEGVPLGVVVGAFFGTLLAVVESQVGVEVVLLSLRWPWTLDSYFVAKH